MTLFKHLPKLPICDVLPELLEHLGSTDQLVLEAPPGAGKTTLVPLALLEQPWLKGRKIIMLEPRRMAARAAAERMAELLGESVGQRVGYRVRQETRVSSATRIEVLTGGVFTRWLQDDPALDDVGLVIFDEFHERHLDSDLSLALCLQGRQLFRDGQTPLKLLVMSATLDGDAAAAVLGQAPVVRSQGRAFPVEVLYGTAQNLQDPIADATGATILRALEETHGSLLVFLPGQAEIRQVHNWLEGRLAPCVDVLPLFGGLSLNEQRNAIEPSPPGRRKVVLATDVAESSLTIDGVCVVIDAGRSREPAFDVSSGMTRLVTRRVSQASSIQRCGRAGRLEPGRCYRLWSEAQQHQLTPHSTPEILQADLAPLALQLLNWGIDSPDELQWLDAPPPAAWQQALELLTELGAVERIPNGGSRLTTHGEQMAHFPAPPRLAHLLIRGKERQMLDLAAGIAATLMEPPRFESADLNHLLMLISGELPCPGRLKGWLQRARRQAKTFTQLAAAVSVAPREKLLADDALGYLVACAYPDRIAKRRGHDHALYQLSNGRSARVADEDPLANHTWLSCAEVSGFSGQAADRVRLAAPLNPRLFDDALREQVQGQEVCQWDTTVDRFVAERQLRVGRLLLAKQPLATPDPEIKQRALLDFIRQQGLEVLPWTPQLRQWQARVQLVQQACSDTAEWPDLSDQWLLANLATWLAPYLTGVNRLADFKTLDLAMILQAQLSWPLPQRLDDLAPDALLVPSGSRIAINYLESPPVLAVKLQEMFGCENTPAIAQGRVPLTIHLLSPAGRPLQITQDLAHFWRNGYADVKKEMKGRYPKHPWPDNPLSAPPTRQVKRKLRGD